MKLNRLALTIITLSAVGGAGYVVTRNSTQVLPNGTRADLLVVEKSAHTLTAYWHHEVIRKYRIALSNQSTGTKTKALDRKTPEGRYVIDSHNLASAFHLALHISYPSPHDLEQARSGGYSPGGDIMIHGIRNGFGWLGAAHRLIDWTAGCIAVTDTEIEELYRVVPDGTPVDIRP